MKHVWINKRTDKGVKPVREWIECKTCGVTWNPLASAATIGSLQFEPCKGKPS